MSMSEMDQGEPERKEDRIEEVIELNHQGHNSAVSLWLPLASDSNNHTNLHRTSEDTNDNNFSGGLAKGKKRNAHLMGSNIQDDSVLQSKVLRFNFPSLATGSKSKNDKVHSVETSICTINKLQEHKHLPIFSNVTAALETDNKTIKTAFMKVSEFGYIKLLEIMLDHGVCFNIRKKMKRDALLIALKFGQVDCAKLLLSSGAHLDLPTAAKLTVENKQSAAFQFLANHYKKMHVHKDNLLFLAVKMGVEDIVSLLINMGADVNKGDSNGITPLEVALMSQQGESLIKCLIQNGACVNGNGNFVPFHKSMLYSLEVTKLLLDSGADVNARMYIHMDTALIAACDKGLDLEIVKLLFAKGAQPNLQNKIGHTALHEATLMANVDLVQLLVASGADLEIQTRGNKTAYLLAADMGNLKLIKALQNLGSNTSAVDYSGCNALMLAIQFAQIKCLETSTLLYLAGNVAQINHQCNKGYTALMLAAKTREWELLKRLLDLGADVNITATFSSGRSFTALSILLNKFRNSSNENSILDCIEELIRHGAVNSLPKSCNDVLYKMIIWDKRRMVQLLLTNGMAPTMVRFQTLYDSGICFGRMRWLDYRVVSPLTVALACGNIWVAQYLVRNWALCPFDLNSLSLKKLIDSLVATDKSESVEIFYKLFCQPASLLQLSFITVSHALGGVPGREDRINSLPLPQVIKKKLMFREETVQTDLTKDLSVVNLDYYDLDNFFYDSSDLDDVDHYSV